MGLPHCHPSEARRPRALHYSYCLHLKSELPAGSLIASIKCSTLNLNRIPAAVEEAPLEMWLVGVPAFQPTAVSYQMELSVGVRQGGWDRPTLSWALCAVRGLC